MAWFRNNDSYQIVSRLESGALARHSITPSSLAPGFLPSIAIEADRKIVFGVVGSQTTEVFRWDPGAGAPIAVRSVPGTFGLIDELNEFGRVILMHQPQILSIDAAEPVTWNETRVGGHPRSTFLQDGRGIVAYPRAVVSFNADGQQRAAFHNTEAPWRTRAPVDDSGAIVSGGNFVKRLGANGETLWSKTYTDSLSSVDVSENGFSIVATFQDQFTYNPNGVQISRVQPFSSMKFVFGNSIVSGYQGGSGFVARSRFPTGGWSVSPLAFTKPAWHKLTDAIWVSARRNSMSFIHDLSRIDAIGVLANYGMQLSEQPSDLSVCPNGDVLAATQNQLHRFVVLGNSHRQLVSAQPRIISVRCTNNNIAVIFSAFNDNKYDLRVQTVSEEGRVLSTQDLYSGVVADTFPASPITTYALPNGDLRWMREAFIPPQSQAAVDTVIYASEILSSKGFE